MIEEKVIMPASDYKNLCDKVREKTGSTELIKSGDMRTLIDNIQTGKEEQKKTVSITENGTYEVLPDENKVLSKVEVNVEVEDNSVLMNSQGRIYVKNPVILDGVTEIGNYVFSNCEINTVSLPLTITKIGDYAFNTTDISNVNLSLYENLTSIGTGAFNNCKNFAGRVDLSNLTKLSTLGQTVFYRTAIESVKLNHKITVLSNQLFGECNNLTSVELPNTIKQIGWEPFYKSNNIEFVTLEEGFNANSLSLSNSTKYSVETIVSWGEALYDRTGLVPYTIVIGAANIAKLTDEQIAVFTNKNWTLA